MFVLGENHFRKCFSRNAGVWLVRKIEFSGNWFLLTQKKKALTTEMNFRSYFHFKWISERESESARGRQRPSRRRSHVQAPVDAIRKHQRRRSRSEIANLPSRRSQSARCFARSRSTARSSDWSSRSTAPSNPVERWASIWVLCSFFWFCLFPCSIFQAPENIFRKIFWNTTKHIKTFSFPENGIFSGNAFMRTKHSLELMTLPFIPLLRKRKIPFEVEFIGMSVSKISTRQMCANSQFYESHPKQPSLVLFSR